MEQDDVPEPVAEESSSSSSSGESESEEEDDAVPALPDKDLPQNATVNTATASENTAVHNVAAQSGSSDPNMDTLRPGRKSPLVPSVSEFGSTSTSQAGPSSSSARASPRPSLDVVRPASPRATSGNKTPPSRGSRVGSSRSVPPSGAAVAAALEPHTTPHNAHHHHHHHSSHHSGNGDAAFSPPSAGDFDPDIRRGSIYVHGADGHAMHIPITGRSRPGSVHEADFSSDHHQHHHHHHNTHQSPSVSAAEKSKARSVKSMRMTKSKNSMGSLRNAAASSPSHGPSTSAGQRRRPSAPSSSDEDDTSPMDIEGPLTARPMPGAVSAPGQYPFPNAVVDSTTPTMTSPSGTMEPQAPHSEDVDMESEHDVTPPMSNKEDSDAAGSKGKGRSTRSASGSTHRDNARQGGADGSKQTREEASASVHAIV